SFALIRGPRFAVGFLLLPVAYCLLPGLSVSICVNQCRSAAKRFCPCCCFCFCCCLLPIACSLLPRHCFHQKSKRTVETLVTCLTSFVMPQAPHDQIVRWNDESGLPTCPGHIVGLFGHRKHAVAIDPEEAAINGTLISFPGRRQCADESDVPFGQNSFSVPH